MGKSLIHCINNKLNLALLDTANTIAIFGRILIICIFGNFHQFPSILDKILWESERIWNKKENCYEKPFFDLEEKRRVWLEFDKVIILT